MADLLDLIGRLNYPFGKQEPDGQFCIVTRRPHRDRDRTVPMDTAVIETNPDLKRFFDRKYVAGFGRARTNASHNNFR